MLSRDEYIEQDERAVDKELDNRKSVINVYNKRRTDSDFPPGPEGDELYDKYLEDIEDMVMILSSTIATEEDKNKIRRKIMAEKKST